MLKLLVIILITLTGSFGKKKEEETEWKKSEAHTFYDQRQTGKYNLNVNIKDVQFFSLSDSLGNIGDYGSYGDYPDYVGEGDEDYNISHLTVNPIFAFLGSKPTKPTTTTSTTTEKSSIDSSSSLSSILEITTENTVAVAGQNIQSTSTLAGEIATTTTSTTAKPALTSSSTENSPLQPLLKVNETIEYDEIPVEVLYYRANQQQQHKLKNPLVISHNNNNRRKLKRRQPSVQIIDGQSEHPTVKICGRGEFRDNLGRCRIRMQRNHANGL